MRIFLKTNKTKINKLFSVNYLNFKCKNRIFYILKCQNGLTQL